MNWYKKAQETRWFTWEDEAGDKWNISYKNIPNDELYDEEGKSISKRSIIEKMITDIYLIETGDSVVVDSFLDDEPLLEDEFFDEVRNANLRFEDERRIELRDIGMGLYDHDSNIDEIRQHISDMDADRMTLTDIGHGDDEDYGPHPEF